MKVIRPPFDGFDAHAIHPFTSSDELWVWDRQGGLAKWNTAPLDHSTALAASVLPLGTVLRNSTGTIEPFEAGE